MDAAADRAPKKCRCMRQTATNQRTSRIVSLARLRQNTVSRSQQATEKTALLFEPIPLPGQRSWPCRIQVSATALRSRSFEGRQAVAAQAHACPSVFKSRSNCHGAA